MPGIASSQNQTWICVKFCLRILVGWLDGWNWLTGFEVLRVEGHCGQVYGCLEHWMKDLEFVMLFVFSFLFPSWLRHTSHTQERAITPSTARTQHNIQTHTSKTHTGTHSTFRAHTRTPHTSPLPKLECTIGGTTGRNAPVSDQYRLDLLWATPTN